MKDIEEKINDSLDGITVKEYLTKKGFSVTLIKRVKYGGVTVGGLPVTVRYRLKTGEVIKISLPDAKNESIVPIDIPIRVLYEDEYFVAVKKPKNMPTHPSKGNSLPTLANALMAKYGEGFTFRAVNRLDRDTSGVVLIAKDAYTAAKMAEDMKSGSYEKTYHAIVSGTPNPPSGVINAPIERESEDSVKRCVRPDGKPAVTEYEVIETRGATSLLCVRPKTGRTHQIRVHLSYIGHPLVGDFLYGERNEEGYSLNCSEIKFPHPITREVMSVKSIIDF